MIVNNIWKTIGDFFTNVLFYPYDQIRFMDNWWLQNSVTWVFTVFGIIGTLYWLGQLRKFKKAESR